MASVARGASAHARVMATEDTARPCFTIIATAVSEDAWDVTVVGLRDTWTVAFSEAEIENRVRMRIVLDTRLEPDEFDVEIRLVRTPGGAS